MHEFSVGGHYRALISGRFITVRLDRIEDTNRRAGCCGSRAGKRYHVTNIDTGRTLSFSATKFRYAVRPCHEAEIKGPGSTK